MFDSSFLCCRERSPPHLACPSSLASTSAKRVCLYVRHSLQECARVTHSALREELSSPCLLGPVGGVWFHRNSGKSVGLPYIDTLLVALSPTRNLCVCLRLATAISVPVVDKPMVDW